MKREDIEKAAAECRLATAQSMGVYGQYHSIDECPEHGLSCDELVEDSFIKGAEWRINSVWHDMKSEEPQVYGEYENEVYPQIPCLVRGQLSTGYGYGVRYWNTTEKVWDDEECDDFECKKDDIEKWAYLDDLIPNTEE